MYNNIHNTQLLECFETKPESRILPQIQFIQGNIVQIYEDLETRQVNTMSNQELDILQSYRKSIRCKNSVEVSKVIIYLGMLFIYDSVNIIWLLDNDGFKPLGRHRLEFMILFLCSSMESSIPAQGQDRWLVSLLSMVHLKYNPLCKLYVPLDKFLKTLGIEKSRLELLPDILKAEFRFNEKINGEAAISQVCKIDPN